MGGRSALSRLSLVSLLLEVPPVAAQERPGVADLLGPEQRFLFGGGEEIVEAASLHPQKVREAPSSVTVITAEEIRASAARTLTDLLRRVPGLDVFHRRHREFPGAEEVGSILGVDLRIRF